MQHSATTAATVATSSSFHTRLLSWTWFATKAIFILAIAVGAFALAKHFDLGDFWWNDPASTYDLQALSAEELAAAQAKPARVCSDDYECRGFLDYSGTPEPSRPLYITRGDVEKAKQRVAKDRRARDVEVAEQRRLEEERQLFESQKLGLPKPASSASAP